MSQEQNGSTKDGKPRGLLWNLLGGALIGAVVALVMSQDKATVKIEINPKDSEEPPAQTG